MSDSPLKQKLSEDMKTAMRNKDKARLGVIRLALAAIKQIEVDKRIDLDDTQILAVLDKMLKQRRDSIEQFEAAARQDLVDQEKFELTVLQDYMPQALSDDEIATIIGAAIQETGANSMKEMGKVMNIVRPKVQGRADMGAVSGKIKALIGA